MSAQEIIVWAGAILTTNSVLLAFLSYKLRRRSENRKALLEHLDLYHRTDVQKGIQRLWQLFRDSNNNVDRFLDSYVQTWEREEREHIPTEQQLHSLRRSATLFWRSLGALLQHDLLPRHIVYRLWAQDDVDIVDRILIEVENRIARHLGISELNPETDPLYYLSRVKHKFFKTRK